jgi:ubiquinone biosynthesis protein COQ9
VEELSAEQRIALEKLKAYELKVAKISFRLEEEIFDPLEAEIEKEMYARDTARDTK